MAWLFEVEEGYLKPMSAQDGEGALMSTAGRPVRTPWYQPLLWRVHYTLSDFVVRSHRTERGDALANPQAAV